MQENISEDNDNDDLYEHHTVCTASVGQEPLRVDKFLMNFIGDVLQEVKCSKLPKLVMFW